MWNSLRFIFSIHLHSLLNFKLKFWVRNIKTQYTWHQHLLFFSLLHFASFLFNVVVAFNIASVCIRRVKQKQTKMVHGSGERKLLLPFASGQILRFLRIFSGWLKLRRFLRRSHISLVNMHVEWITSAAVLMKCTDIDKWFELLPRNLPKPAVIQLPPGHGTKDSVNCQISF